MDPKLRNVALAWAADDPDAQTAAEVRDLVARGDEAALADRFSSSLMFGTAGLRGVIGGGSNRMNRAVVRRTTAGLAKYLLQTVPDARTRGVVIGRDGRIMSEEFAADSAAVLAGYGIKVWEILGATPTPYVSFAVMRHKAAAGIMITASHNPREYNGYKIYWGNGAQIIPPHDVDIAEAIAGVGAVAQIPYVADVRGGAHWEAVAAATERAYLDAILALRPTRQAGVLPIVYTALHGVGGRLMLQALAEAGFRSVRTVSEQHEPDGQFPTVKFPNPEEPGALDLAAALARATNARLVLATDPDADRLAVMARDGQGALRMLSGNQLGILLAQYLLEHREPSSRKPVVMTSIVSSAQLRQVAKARGADYAEVLTGFKWIANEAIARDAGGEQFVMGFEEALGYTVGAVARDKDGIGSGLVVADMAAWCESQNMTLFSYWERICREVGFFGAHTYNATLPGAQGAEEIAKLMRAFRQKPLAATELTSVRIVATSDYQVGTRVEGGTSSPLNLPKADVLGWDLEGGGRIKLRPSGTEPKVKAYFELRDEVDRAESLGAAEQRVAARLQELQTTFLAAASARGCPLPSEKLRHD